MDEFDGFKVLARVIEPHSGDRSFILDAQDISKGYKHTSPWIQSFNCDVEVIPVLSDEGYVEATKELLSKQ